MLLPHAVAYLFVCEKMIHPPDAKNNGSSSTRGWALGGRAQDFIVRSPLFVVQFVGRPGVVSRTDQMQAHIFGRAQHFVEKKSLHFYLIGVSRTAT